MIGLANSERDTDGAIILTDAENLAPESSPTRASRSKTMDSGTVIVNQGTDYGDETYSIVTTVTEAEYNIIDGIQRNSNRCTLATRNGVFSGIISNKTLRGDILTITFWVEEKL